MQLEATPREAYDRYRSRINPSMLSKFHDRFETLKLNLKLFPDQPTRSKAAYGLVRRELKKYQLNGGLIDHLDELSRNNEYKRIVEFLE